ncbi:ISNCY family transposase [Aminithiophilus ramosus]|nr:ISNCY family transposase [Aminithiophilus ramosus]
MPPFGYCRRTMVLSLVKRTGKMSLMTTRRDLLMKTKEARRLGLVEEAVAGNLTVQEVADRLGLSRRQVFRLKRRYREEGAQGLLHKGRGKPSRRRISQETRDFVVSLAKGLYRDTSCQHMAELLAEEHDLVLSAKSIARFLRAENLSLVHRHRAPKRRSRRVRRSRRGDLVQMDASPFDWFEIGERCTLHGVIDDATGEVLGLWMARNECLFGYFRVLRQMLDRHGVPRELYADRHTIFLSPKSEKLTIKEELEDSAPVTQFGRALEALGTRYVPAGSPQAKGRIERLWGTLQDRLVVAFRRAGVKTIEEANVLLAAYPGEVHNPRFARPPAEGASAFLPPPDGPALDLLLTRQTDRKASGDSTISLDGKLYALIGPRRRPLLLARGQAVKVIEKLDGKLLALVHDGLYDLAAVDKEPPATPPPVIETKTGTPCKTKKQRKPAADHPWRQNPAPPAAAVGSEQGTGSPP